MSITILIIFFIPTIIFFIQKFILGVLSGASKFQIFFALLACYGVFAICIILGFLIGDIADIISLSNCSGHPISCSAFKLISLEVLSEWSLPVMAIISLILQFILVRKIHVSEVFHFAKNT